MTLRIIGGKFKGRILQTPKGTSTRPTQSVLREALFNICQQDILGCNFLDLFAGSGAIGFEALSRGALHTTFIESNKQAILSIQNNNRLLDVDSNVTLLAFDWKKAISCIQDPFDIIYIDPPYSLSPIPFVEAILQNKLLKSHGLLFIEEQYKNRSEGAKIPPLRWRKSRKFGTAVLHEYSF